MNSRGIIVYEEPPHSILDRNSSEFEQLRLYLFSTQIDSDFIILESPEFISLPKTTKILMTKNKDDRFVFFVTNTTNSKIDINIDPFESEIAYLTSLRESQREKFKGLLFIDFDDYRGPELSYNSSILSDEEGIKLGLQCFSTLGLGSTGNFHTGFHGPIILSDKNLAVLIYSFIRPAPQSTDVRLKKKGRPSIIIILFQSAEDAENKLVRSFIETALQRNYLTEQAEVSSEQLNEILQEIKDVSLFALDLTFADQMDRIAAQRLRETVIKLQKENRALKQKIKELEESLNSIRKEN